jgi:quinol monooxygenase YgiN
MTDDELSNVGVGATRNMTIHVWTEFAVREGNEEAMRDVGREMTVLVRALEPGTLDYSWYFSDDGRTCHVYERMADEAAIHAHGMGEAVRVGIPQVLAIASFSRFEVHGALSDPTAEYLRGVGATVYTP